LVHSSSFFRAPPDRDSNCNPVDQLDGQRSPTSKFLQQAEGSQRRRPCRKRDKTINLQRCRTGDTGRQYRVATLNVTAKETGALLRRNTSHRMRSIVTPPPLSLS
jgi:hypothetical protein